VANRKIEIHKNSFGYLEIKMEINTNAPVFARKEIIIHAPVEKVWQIQSDIEAWPEWQPDITSIQLNGNLKAGSTFRWKAQGLMIQSRFHTVEPYRRMGWTGTAPGMGAIHNWTFEPRDETTLAVTEESLSGWLTRLMKLFNPHFLEKSLEATLQRLKTKAEEK
jgi:uncharacterized membrane protein